MRLIKHNKKEFVVLSRQNSKKRFELNSKQGEHIENILSMQGTVVREIMVPRVDMNAIDIDGAMRQIEGTARNMGLDVVEQ